MINKAGNFDLDVVAKNYLQIVVVIINFFPKDFEFGDCYARFPYNFPNLASKILSLNIKRLSKDWQERFNHPIVLAETFVDPRYFVGTSYDGAREIPKRSQIKISSSIRTLIFYHLLWLQHKETSL